MSGVAAAGVGGKTAETDDSLCQIAKLRRNSQTVLLIYETRQQPKLPSCHYIRWYVRGNALYAIMLYVNSISASPSGGVVIVRRTGDQVIPAVSVLAVSLLS